jgi:hypothetical protein
MGITSTLKELAKYGINAQIQSDKIILIYPKNAIEQKILEEIVSRAPQELKNKITVRALGDVIVEVSLI